MTLPQLKPSVHSLEDWRGWEGRWELIHGVAYDMTPAPSTEHQRLSFSLGGHLFQALNELKGRSGEDCQGFAAPVDVFLGESVVQPDLIIVCDRTKVSERGIEGAPDLVVEILSPSTAEKDLSRKQWLYEASGVPEYLILYPDQKVGVLLRLEDGRYQGAARVEWGSRVGLLGGTLCVPLG